MDDTRFLDDLQRNQVLTSLACGKCGDCVLACPVYEERGFENKNIAPAYKLRELRALIKKKYGLLSLISGPGKMNPDRVKRLVDNNYYCTLCGRCNATCPFQFDLMDIWEKLREEAVNSGLGPENVLTVKEAVDVENNIYKMPHTARKEWVDYGETAVPIKNNAETVYFVGCTTSYSGVLMPVAESVASILNALKEDWTILANEKCCGTPLRFTGATENFKEFVISNVEAIESTGAKRVVFNCPGCYRNFKQVYPEIIGRPLEFELLHVIELVDQEIQKGTLKPDKLASTVTYHDPCELTRLMGLVNEPRRIFQLIASDFVEMPENKFDVRCCGAGGAFKVIDIDSSVNLSKTRLHHAQQVGATLLTSACPACKLNLDQAATDLESDIQVMDLIEVVAQQLGLMEF
jgi:heterodisulfide reductase subunit D